MALEERLGHVGGRVVSWYVVGRYERDGALKNMNPRQTQQKQQLNQENVRIVEVVSTQATWTARRSIDLLQQRSFDIVRDSSSASSSSSR